MIHYHLLLLDFWISLHPFIPKCFWATSNENRVYDFPIIPLKRYNVSLLNEDHRKLVANFDNIFCAL